jgi:hypothetical protein
VLWTDGDRAFPGRSRLAGWRYCEKLDGEFLPETQGEAARRRIDSVLNILEKWDHWITRMGGDHNETGRKESRRSDASNAICAALSGLEMLR